jgi:hypothetical protein
MSPRRDPMRLTDPGAGAPSELAEAIRELQAQRGSLEQALGIRQRLVSELGPEVLSGARIGSASCSGWCSKLLLVTMVSMPFVPSSWASKTPAAKALVENAAPSRAPIATSEVAPPPALELKQEPAKERPRETRQRHTRRERKDTVLGPPVVGVAPEAEIALLQSSRAALRKDPERALALAQQHAHDYPQGVFAQEREILAIEALLKRHRLESRLRAFARARAFITAYPSSSYAFRIQRLIDEWAGPAELPAPAPAEIAAAVSPDGT